MESCRASTTGPGLRVVERAAGIVRRVSGGFPPLGPKMLSAGCAATRSRPGRPLAPGRSWPPSATHGPSGGRRGRRVRIRRSPAAVRRPTRSLRVVRPPTADIVRRHPSRPASESAGRPPGVDQPPSRTRRGTPAQAECAAGWAVRARARDSRAVSPCRRASSAVSSRPSSQAPTPWARAARFPPALPRPRACAVPAGGRLSGAKGASLSM